MTLAKQKRERLAINECWLFAIASKTDLARRLSTEGFKVSVADLERLSVDIGNFRLFSIKQGNKDRPVQEPIRELQKLHTRIHRLLSRVKVSDYLHSAVKGKSYLTNARAHNLDAPTIKIDVKKFFPSVPRRAIFKFFEETLRCRRDVAGILADLLTFDARLPTGSSASPIIAYYAFKPMFDALADLAEQHGLKMTCYVDDITMSGTLADRSVLYEAHQIIAKAGLTSHKMKVFSGSTPRIITGVCNSPSGERVPNKLHLKIKNGFDELRIAGKTEGVTKITGPLLGRLEAARLIDPTFGERAKTLRSQIKAWGVFSNS
jgi:RNA-directed DNA polymerase